MSIAQSSGFTADRCRTFAFNTLQSSQPPVYPNLCSVYLYIMSFCFICTCIWSLANVYFGFRLKASGLFYECQSKKWVCVCLCLYSVSRVIRLIETLVYFGSKMITCSLLASTRYFYILKRYILKKKVMYVWYRCINLLCVFLSEVLIIVYNV